MDKFDSYYKDYYANWNNLLKDYNVMGIDKEKNIADYKNSVLKKKALTLKKD